MLAVVMGIALVGVWGCMSEPAPERKPGESTPAATPSEWTEPAVRFVDVTEEAGIEFIHTSGGPEQRYILESMGSGSAFFDFDGDGWLDFFAVDGARLEGEPGTGNMLWRNVEGMAGRVFADVTAGSGLQRVGWGMGSAVADSDNDGDLDLYVTYWGPNGLYRNDGDGVFSAIEAGVEDGRWGTSAAFGDVDGDGWQDLYVANYLVFDIDDPPGGGEMCSGWKGLTVFCGPYGLDGDADVLYRNEGSGAFVDMSAETGVDSWDYLGLGVLFTDFDADGDQDLYIANDSTPNQLYRNDGDWNLAEIGAFAGVAYSEEGRVQAGMGLDVGDYDNDGDGDLFVTNFSDDVNTLYENRGDGSYVDATYAANLGGAVRPYLGWSTALADFDNDSWLDLFVANGHLYPQLDAHPLGLSYRQRDLLYWNRGGAFVLNVVPGLEAERVSRGAAFGDYDNDGDLDIAVNNLNDRPSLLRNDGGNLHNWLGLELIAADGRSAEGAKVRLWTEGRVLVRLAKRGYGYLSASDGRVRFGLETGRADSVEITWPGGWVQMVESLPTRRYIVVREGAGAAVADYSVVADTAAGRTVMPRRVAPSPEVAQAFDPNSSAQTYYERANVLYSQGRYREVLALLQPTLEHYKEDTRLHYTAAVALYSGLGRYEEAAAVLEPVVTRDSVVVEAVELLGVVYLHLNRPQQAVATLSRAMARAPGNWETHYRLGLAHTRLGADLKAIAAFSQALELAPEEPMPHLHLAQIRERLGQGQEARAALGRFEALKPFKQEVDRYRQAIRANPGNSTAYAALGLVLAQAGHLDAARGEYERALALDPDMVATRTNLANVLLRQGQPAAALEQFQYALAGDSDLAEAHYGLGMAHYGLGTSTKALEAIERALALRPDFPKALVNAGVISMEQGRPRDALDHFRRAFALVPDDVQAGNNLVAALIQTGQLEAAREVFVQAAARQVQLSHARKALVQALLASAQRNAEQGQWSAAIQRQRQAISLTPARLQRPLQEQLATYEVKSK